MGMFMEAVAIILITLPILLPAMQIFGVDVIHFAVIMTVNMELAMITPPVGLNLFVVSGVGEEDVTRVFKGVAPFFLLLLLGLVIIMVFPPLSLFILGR
jgi:C4-dicarboxylate transporter DctM subunit